MNSFQKTYYLLLLRNASDKADKAAKKERHSFYVLPSADGTLIVCDRRNFRILRRKGYIPQWAMMREAVNACFYSTHEGDNADPGANLRKTYRVARYLRWRQSRLDAKRERLVRSFRRIAEAALRLVQMTEKR